MIPRSRAAAWLLALVLAAHLPALWTTQFHYDDGHSIVRNPHLDGDLARIGRFFADPSLFGENPADAMYRPLVLVAHSLNAALTPGRPAGFIFLNLLVHLAAVWTLFVVLRQLIGGRSAWIGALFFGLHPLQTEVVNYASARSESLAALGVLLCVVAFVRYRQTGGAAWLVAVAAAQAAAVAAKETGIVAPMLLLGLHWLQPQGDRRAAGRGITVSVVVSVIYLIVRQLVMPPSGGELVRPMLEQLSTQSKALVHYLRAVVTPVDLSVTPQFSTSLTPADPTVAAALLLLISVAMLIWRARSLAPGVALGAGWWIVCLAPTLLVPLNVLINDHRPYLALAGLPLLAASWRRHVPTTRLWVAIGCVAILLCWQRASNWRTEISLWEDAVSEGAQVAEARHNLAFAQHMQGDLSGAMQQYEAAIALKPDYTRPLTNLGVLYREQGKFEQAEALLLRAAQSDPAAVEPLSNLGLVYADKGQPHQAIQAYQAALQLDAGVAEIWLNLGLAQRDAGQRDQAVRSLQRALQLDPSIRQRLAPPR